MRLPEAPAASPCPPKRSASGTRSPRGIGPGGFIDAGFIEKLLENPGQPSASRVREITQKSLAVETLGLDEAAVLVAASGDPALFEEMTAAAAAIKRKVYDNRIVTFAPLYLGNRCVNDCRYCAFRASNAGEHRSVLSMEELRQEVEVIAGRIGHKRLIAVVGEHPSTGVEYITEALGAIYGVKARSPSGRDAGIRRVNVNAAPMSVADLKELKKAGIGTYQVFQESYHPAAYAALHPAGTPKADFLWRLHSMHRALEAGVDDVGIGALFGLSDWRFEVMGLLSHARELEASFGIGPHTISFPRLEPAFNTPVAEHPPAAVSDGELLRAIVILRLAVPYAGMILTARESAGLRRRAIACGITQTDASSRIGIGSYSDSSGSQRAERQQFILGDERSLDEVIRELAGLGHITSFCTAGYRCGRTGPKIMNLLRSGREGVFCKLNAIITFREWLDDFASPETRIVGEELIARELREARKKAPELAYKLDEMYALTAGGERDLFF